MARPGPLCKKLITCVSNCEGGCIQGSRRHAAISCQHLHCIISCSFNVSGDHSRKQQKATRQLMAFSETQSLTTCNDNDQCALAAIQQTLIDQNLHTKEHVGKMSSRKSRQQEHPPAVTHVLRACHQRCVFQTWTYTSMTVPGSSSASMVASRAAFSMAPTSMTHLLRLERALLSPARSCDSCH